MKRRRGEEERRKRLCSATGSTEMKMWLLPMEGSDRNPRPGLCWGGNVKEAHRPMYRNVCVPTHMRSVWLGVGVGIKGKTLGLHTLDYPAISKSPRLLSLDIPWLTCVTTHSQITGPLIHLWGWLGGWEGCGWSATPRIIQHLAFPRWGGRGAHVVALLTVTVAVCWTCHGALD